MLTVEVNGDLAGAVDGFKRSQQYFPPHELEARKAFRAECKRKRKARGKK